jgi:hypothetical protein
MFDCQRVTGFGSTKMLDIMGYPEKNASLMRCDPSQFSGGFKHIWDQIWMVVLKIRGYGWWDDRMTHLILG